MSEESVAILATVAFVALAFALVYTPWPKSKEYREQQAIAERHYQDYVRAALSNEKEKG